MIKKGDIDLDSQKLIKALYTVAIVFASIYLLLILGGLSCIGMK